MPLVDKKMVPGRRMQLDKDMILEYLRERGEHDKADEAECELPATVDHEGHGDVLSRLGVPGELLARARSGQGGIPDVLKKL